MQSTVLHEKLSGSRTKIHQDTKSQVCLIPFGEFLTYMWISCDLFIARQMCRKWENVKRELLHGKADTNLKAAPMASTIEVV